MFVDGGLAFGFAAPEYQQVLRIAHETDERGEVSAVVLMQLDLEGSPHNTYHVPLDAARTISIASRQREVGVVLEPPLVGPKRAEEEHGQRGA